jgi:capsular exopolysaccharide synthesis family protein
MIKKSVMKRNFNNNIQNNQQNIKLQESIGVDPVIVLSMLIKNWYWFIISAAISLGYAHLYLGHTLPVFQTSITVLVNETEDRPLVDNTALLQGLGLPGGMKNLQNQMLILKSRDLTEKTLKNLPFEIDFYYKTSRNNLPIYPELPVRIVPENMVPLPKDIEFSITYLENGMFTLESKSEYYPFNKTASFGDSIVCPGGSFFIECRDEEVFNKDKNKQIFFAIHNINSLVNYYSNRLNIELTSRDGSILRISLTGTNRAKDADFLNQHIDGFRAISLDRKNTEAARRIQFIEDQLIGISDSLSTTETRLQQFRSSHRVMDLSAQGQSIIAQVTLLENERARLSLEANYYEYLADYLNKDVSGEIPIVPITMGINDPGLTRLVEELAEFQGQLASRGAGELNPLQRNLEQRMQAAKGALKETLNGLRRANSLARSENQQQINRANAQASALPVTERQLLGIERKFRLNDELYTFLLEARAEQNMQKASNRSDSEVVDPADERFSVMVAPNPAMIYLMGILGGFGFPALIIFTLFFLNKKLKEEDVKKLTNMPVVGYIPQNSGKNNTVVFENSNSIIAESYRLLRSRMQFMTKEAASPVILVTSSMPGEGKTFTSINLASVYSLLGKKTILIGFDLRKPKISKDFGLDNKKGISTWLIGQNKLEDIIQETIFENLSIIPSGPIPPNPSELIALEKTGELIKTLKERYDYIIIDSSPIGIVSDTLHLASMADAFLLVVRPEYTLKDMLNRTLNEITINKTKGVSLVINGIKAGSRYYSYGEKYGYTTEKTAKGRLFKMRKTAKS